MMSREHGHQIIWVVIPLMLSCGSMFVATTWYLSQHIESIKEDNLQASANLLARLGADEQRISAVEKTETEHYAEESAFQTEVRSVNNTLLQALADLKVQLSTKEDLRRR